MVLMEGITIKSIKASELAAFINKKLIGSDIEINIFATMNKPTKNSVIFARQYSKELVVKSKEINSLLVIACPEYAEKLNCSYIISSNPRLDFIRIITKYFAPEKQPSAIHPTAIIEAGAKIGRNVTIGAHCFIGEDVTIGDNTEIHHNVTILGKVNIGKDCFIKSGAVIGEEGFGFEYDESGAPEHFPHLGRIEIGDRVFIGANTTIERAALDVTKLCDDVKVDDLVQIGHNTITGKNSSITSGVVLCGGAIVGEGCWIAPNSSVIQRINIGNGGYVGLGSVVLSNVGENSVVVGVPAKLLKKK